MADIWTARPGDGSSAEVNWSRIARALDYAACDVLQILDCCFAATATKGRENKESAGALLDSIHDDATKSSEYRGTNEYLASSSRDNRSHCGEYSSMRPFANELRKLAEGGKPFTVQEWYYAIDTAVVESNEITTANTTRETNKRATRGYASPAHKIQPKERARHSIILKPKSSGLSQQQDPDAEGHVYAKVKLVNGEETARVYFTESQMREQFS